MGGEWIQGGAFRVRWWGGRQTEPATGSHARQNRYEAWEFLLTECVGRAWCWQVPHHLVKGRMIWHTEFSRGSHAVVGVYPRMDEAATGVWYSAGFLPMPT